MLQLDYDLDRLDLSAAFISDSQPPMAGLSSLQVGSLYSTPDAVQHMLACTVMRCCCAGSDIMATIALWLRLPPNTACACACTV